MTTESLSVTIEGELLTVEIGTVAAPAGGGGGGTWGSITGTLSAQTDLQSALDLKAPLASPTLTGTPAAPTAAGGTSTTQIATTAFVGGAVTTHAGATDPHGDRAFATSAVSTHNAVTTAHGISAFGATLVDDADASAARTTLGLGTAATAATGDFAAASHNHAASAITSGTLAHERGGLEADVSAYSGLVKITGGATSAVTVTAAGEALLDDADASAQRTTLGLGDLSTVTPGTGVATFLTTPSSANLAAAVTDETGSGALVFATSPTLVTPALGTPSSGTLTNCTGYPAASSTASGIVELAIASEVDTGTDATRAMTPDSYRDSTPYYVDRTADWTLAQADANTEQQFNSASARVCTIDTNANVAISTQTVVPFLRLGSGSATIDAVAGVTLNGVDGASKVINTQYQGALLRKVGTNAWVISGDIA